jgi:hypothetical protein
MLRKRSKTLRNALKTIENAQERSETVRNCELSGTVNGLKRYTVQDHGPKRLQNHGHVHAPKTKELLYHKYLNKNYSSQTSVKIFYAFEKSFHFYQYDMLR